VIIVVSNLWPRAKFYEDVPQVARKLLAYRGDPVIDACDALVPIESFMEFNTDLKILYNASNTAAAEENINEESDVFGGLSQETIDPEIIRQYIFFTLVLRSLYLKYATEISAVVGYCSGVIPVLNAMAVDGLDDRAVFQLPDLLLRQLSMQDAAVARNVVDHDVVMAMVRLKVKGPSRHLLLEMLEQDVGRGVFVTDWKAENVASLCASREAMKSFLAELEKKAGGLLDPIRLIPHGGLHTPLAAPKDCFTIQGGPQWQSLFEKVKRSKQAVWTSAGRSINPDGGIDEFEGVMRDTLFRCVQTGLLVDNLRKNDDAIRCVGLPSVISDMFLGTGIRLRRNTIIGHEAL
jgi:hypothetical protein